jgi:hypothetical protein
MKNSSKAQASFKIIVDFKECLVKSMVVNDGGQENL